MKIRKHIIDTGIKFRGCRILIEKDVTKPNRLEEEILKDVLAASCNLVMDQHAVPKDEYVRTKAVEFARAIIAAFDYEDVDKYRVYTQGIFEGYSKEELLSMAENFLKNGSNETHD